RVAAWRASLAAARDGYRALDELRVPELLAPELPVRRRQAALGLSAASAALDQAEREAAYAVTRAWFSVLFALEQQRVAQSVVDRLTATHDAAKKQLEGGARDVSAA